MSGNNQFTMATIARLVYRVAEEQHTGINKCSVPNLPGQILMLGVMVDVT